MEEESARSNHVARAVGDWWPNKFGWRAIVDLGTACAGLLLAFEFGWESGVREELALFGFGALTFFGAEAVRLAWHLYRAPFRQRDELRAALAVRPGKLLPQKLYLVFDCKGRGSGFLGVTDKRIIARDDGRRGREKQIVSIPFSRVHAVSVESDRGWVRGSSLLAISAGDDDWSFEFKGADKAKKAYTRIMESVLA